VCRAVTSDWRQRSSTAASVAAGSGLRSSPGYEQAQKYSTLLTTDQFLKSRRTIADTIYDDKLYSPSNGRKKLN